METRRADIDFLGLDAQRRDEFLKRLEDEHLALRFLRTFEAKRLDGVLFEHKAARLVCLELSQLQAACAKIHRQI